MTHQVRRVWTGPDGKTDEHGPWTDCTVCPLEERDSSFQIVADTLFGLLPNVYGHRLTPGGERANVNDTPLGRDARVIVEALCASDFLGYPQRGKAL